MSTNLSASTLSELSTKTSHWMIDFVELNMDATTASKRLHMSNHYTDLTFGGNTYTAAGQLMNIGTTTDNIEATDDSLSIGLSGIGGSVTSAILNSKVPGSEVKIYRGFFDEYTGLLVDTPYLVWQGLASGYSITDNFDSEIEDAINISVECKSLLSSIMDRQSGLYTSVSSFQSVSSLDESMEFVAGLATKKFNFGKED